MFGHNASHVSRSSPSPYNSYRLDNFAPGSRSSSPAARSIPSGRKGSKKVRTGCVTCKIRKVKCDETKPFCLRCTKTGRKCDGYLDPRALTRRQSFKDPAPHDRVLGAFIDSAAPEEKRALWFWQYCTASRLSGGVDDAFWRVNVLQICETEPAVRYAILAVSSLHESLGGTVSITDDSLARSQQSFALQQYNRAIACLLDQTHNPLTKPLASLLNCILFVCIEYMQGKDKESLIHLEQGRQLLTQLSQCPNDPETEYIVRHIESLYTRLSITSSLFGGSYPSVSDIFESPKEAISILDNFGNTRQSLNEFTEQASHFAHSARMAGRHGESISPETIPILRVEKDRLLAQAAKLSVAFSLVRSSRSTSELDSALLARQIYLHAQQIWISTALSSSELVYDNFTTSFAAIVSLAAAFLDLVFSTNPGMIRPPPSSHSSAASDSLPTSRASNFTFESMIPPLYYVATKCRHPLIRRTALDLLRRNPFRTDNLWQASVMGSLAGHIVCLEERRSRGQSLDHNSPPHTSFYDAALCSTSLGAGWGLTAATTAVSSSPIPTTSFTGPVDLALPEEHLLTSSFSPSPSLTSSAGDGYLSNSMGGPIMAFLTPPMNSNTWQQQHFQQHGTYSVPQAGYATQASHRIIQAQSYEDLGHCSVDYSSPESSSEISSVDLEEGHHYPTTEPRGRSPPQHSQSRQQTYQQPSYTHSSSSAGMLGRQRSPTPNNLVMEAPFGLPDEMRVHDDATVGSGREDGTWVAVFRQLQGVAADWSV